MGLRPFGRAQAAALAAAGFRRQFVPGPGNSREFDTYRRAAGGRWVLEARQEAAGHVDVGLTLDPPGGTLVGPVHRALSAAALGAALPHIVASLEALAQAAEGLRCPECSSWAVMVEGRAGAYLACGEARRGRTPLSRPVRRCRRNLVMAALVVHRDPTPEW